MWGLCWGGLGGECSRCCAVQVLRWWVWGSPGECFGGIEGLWAGLPLGGAGGVLGWWPKMPWMACTCLW